MCPTRQGRPQVHDTHRKHITPLTDENLFLPATQRPARHNGHAHRADRSRRPDNLHRRRRPNGINHTGRQHSHGPEPQPRQRRRATSRGILRHGRTAGGAVPLRPEHGRQHPTAAPRPRPVARSARLSTNTARPRAASTASRATSPASTASRAGNTAGSSRTFRISDDYRPAAEAYPAEPRPAYVRDTTRYPLKLKPGQHVALNTADTNPAQARAGHRQWLRTRHSALPRTPRRLLLHGTTHGNRQLPAVRLPLTFTADPSLCRKLNVNRLTLSQLRRHPYIASTRPRPSSTTAAFTAPCAALTTSACTRTSRPRQSNAYAITSNLKQLSTHP